LKAIEFILIGVNVVSVEVFGEDVVSWKNLSDFLFLVAFYLKVLIEDLGVEVIAPVIGELRVVWSKNVINEVLFETGEMRHKLNQ
jgi:hypothetical protein